MSDAKVGLDPWDTLTAEARELRHQLDGLEHQARVDGAS